MARCPDCSKFCGSCLETAELECEWLGTTLSPETEEEKAGRTAEDQEKRPHCDVAEVEFGISGRVALHSDCCDAEVRESSIGMESETVRIVLGEKCTCNQPGGTPPPDEDASWDLCITEDGMDEEKKGRKTIYVVTYSVSCKCPCGGTEYTHTGEIRLESGDFEDIN